jgi:Alpha/beta hydrolase family
MRRSAATPVPQVTPHPDPAAPEPGGASRRHFLKSSAAGLAGAAIAPTALDLTGSPARVSPAHAAEHAGRPIMLREQGSFTVGGSMFTAPGTFNPTVYPDPPPDGQTFRGDHAYVQFQIPPNARKLPLVLWHGGGQFSKTWESTPDGREGYQTIFLRRGFAVYMLDQARRGRAGRSTVGTTITPTPNEQALFNTFRLGIWPDFFPNVQFPRDPESLDQYYRQQTPNTGPGDNEVITDAGAALFDQIGPAILVTHSASGILGWLTRIKSGNVRAIVSYEPTTFTFPQGEAPTPPVLFDGSPFQDGILEVSGADFQKLTTIPIQVIFGDNIPTSRYPIGGPDRWRARLLLARQFADLINSKGGNASVVHLPEIGVHGNTHFPFSDLNSLEIANLLSQYLRDQGLHKRGKGR